MLEIAYCERCGLIKPKEGMPTNFCPICKFELRYSDISYLDWMKMTNDQQEQWRNEHIMHDEYTEQFAEKRQRFENNRNAIHDVIDNKDSIMRKPKIDLTHIPHCPICGSADLKKLSTVGKAAKIGIFGIFGMGDVGKTYKCNNCGSKF